MCCFLFAGCNGNQGCEGDSCPVGTVRIVLDQKGDAFCFVESRNSSLHLVGMAHQPRAHPNGGVPVNPTGLKPLPGVPIGGHPDNPTGSKPMIQKPPTN